MLLHHLLRLNSHSRREKDEPPPLTNTTAANKNNLTASISLPVALVTPKACQSKS